MLLLKSSKERQQRSLSTGLSHMDVKNGKYKKGENENENFNV